MKLTKVTITGADNSTPVQFLGEVQNRFPWVEFGILLSATKGSGKGEGRYPGTIWRQKLVDASANLNLSGHLCGKWARECVFGQWSFSDEMLGFDKVCKRIQLNISPYLYRAGEECLNGMLHYSNSRNTQIIIQSQEHDHPFIFQARAKGINAVPLFDKSGGKGKLPKSWPATNTFLTGFAGGLGSENIESQLKLIEKNVEDHPIWIDLESNIRTKDDRLDLKEVVKFLKTVEPFVSI